MSRLKVRSTSSDSPSKTAGTSGKSSADLLEESSKIDRSIVEALKHIDTFYEAPPPGLIKEQEEDRPEDSIPDLPQNRDARDFLAKAPSKGLWMPLGKEVKVMQCWKCKAYGHRSGDKECQLFYSGNRDIEKFRYMHEDPMHAFVQQRKAEKKEERIKQLQALLNSVSSDSEADVGKEKVAAKRKEHKSKKHHKEKKPDAIGKKKRRKEKKERKKRTSRSRSREQKQPRSKT